MVKLILRVLPVESLNTPFSDWYLNQASPPRNQLPLSAAVPDRGADAPILIWVSLKPSVSLHPAGHLDRSRVKPSGPVRVLPSADLPHLLSLIRLTTAARSSAHSFSHSSMEAGCVARAVVVVAAPADVVDPALCAAVVAVVAVPASSSSSLPHAAAVMASATTAATAARRLNVRIPLMSPPWN